MSKEFFPSTEQFKDVISRIVRVPPPHTETKKYIVHHEPRISAAKLAEFAIADPSRKKVIVKNSKVSPKGIQLHYSRVRACIPKALQETGLNAEGLRRYAAQIKALPVSERLPDTRETWQDCDNRICALALEHLAEIAPQIECAGAALIPRPFSHWPSLKIKGVNVSVQPEMLFSVQHRKVTKIGGVILNTGKNDDLSLESGTGKFCAGNYLAALLLLLIETHLKENGTPKPSQCYAVDVFRDKSYSAPPAYKTLIKHLEDACEDIVLRWPSIPVDYAALGIGVEEEEPEF